MSVNPIIFSPIGRTKAFNFDNTIYSYAFDEITGRTFVSGNFTNLEGVARAYIGAYDANGTLSSWYPSINSVARVMIVDGSTLYIGGEFTSVNGSTRKGFAALSTTSGALLSLDPNLEYSGPYDGGVYSPAHINYMTIDTPNNYIHLSGTISRVTGTTGSSSGNNHMVIDKTTGAYVYAVNAYLDDGETASGKIFKMVLHTNGVMYCVGFFNYLDYGGTTYTASGFVSYNASTGVPDTSLLPLFDVYPSGYVPTDVVRLGSAIYFVGTFNTVNGVSRPYGVCSVSAISGAVQSFAPIAYVSTDIRTDGAYLYITGNFTTVNGFTVNNFAVLFTSGNLVSTNKLNPVSWATYGNPTPGMVLQNVSNGVMQYDKYNRLKVWDTRYQSPRN